MFRFLDNHIGSPLVVIPGWAFDYRIFAGLDLPYDYHFFDGPSVSTLVDDLRERVCELGVERVSLLGWSKGAFAACQFASQYPEQVDELLLVGVRRRYDRAELEHMQENLSKNKTACLKGFYRRCFAREEAARYQRFRTTLLPEYMKTMSIERLNDDLDWLGQVEIRPDDLRLVEKIRIIHGQDDAIAPVQQAAELAASLPQSQLLVFERAGHMPFLRGDFGRRLHEH